MKLAKNSEIFLNSSGDYISYNTWIKNGSVGSLHFIFLHDCCAHQEIWKDTINLLGKTLHQYSFKATTFDFVGHGVSGGERSFCHDYNFWFKQLDVLIAEVVTSTEQVVLLGFGLGALVAHGYILNKRERNVSGLILANPLLYPKWPSPYTFPLSSFMGKVHLPMPFSISDLTSGAAKVNEHVTDTFFLKFVTFGLVSEIDKLAQLVKLKLYQSTTPILFLLSGDNCVNNQELTEFTLGGSGSPSQFNFYPRAKHYLFEEDYSDVVCGDLLKWLKLYLLKANI